MLSQRILVSYAFYQATLPLHWKEKDPFECTNHYGVATSRTKALQQTPEDTELQKQSPYRGHGPR